MNEKDFADIIRLVRRAPLNNMDEAEYVAALLQRYASHVNDVTNKRIEKAKQHELKLAEMK